MKVLVSGDWHLDCFKIGKVDPASDLDYRVQDFFASVDYMIDVAIEEKVELFIMNGDLFKGRTATHHIETLVAERFSRIAAHMQLVINLGNHDYTPKQLSYGTHTYSILEKFGLKNFKLCTDMTHLTFEGVDIVLYPYHDLKRVDFASNAELVKWVHEEVGKFPLTQECKLFVGHGTPQGTLINEDWFLDLNIIDEPILPNTLFEPFDMALFSHIHRRHAISDKVFHIGSPERVDFSEAEDDKGFVIYDTDTKTMGWASTNPRPMSDIKLDLLKLSEFDDATEKIIEALTSLPDLTTRMVKMQVELSASAYSQLDHREIQAITDKFFYCKGPKYIVPKVQKTRIREITEQLGVSEALEKVLAAKEELTQNEREQILVRGNGILAKTPQRSSE